MNERRETLVRTLCVPVLLMCTACLHGPTAIKNDLSLAAGVELEQDFGITLGRVGTWFAKQGAKIAMKHGDAADIPSLKGVRKVSVGVYQVRGLRRDYENRRSLSLKDLDLGPTWYPLARIHEPGEDVFVLLKEDPHGQRINALLVVVAERDEWVLVKVRGKLNRVIEEGLRYAFDEIERPDLYTATRRQRGLGHADGSNDPVEAVAEPEPDHESCADLVGSGAGI